MPQPSVIPALQKWISEPWGHPGRRTIPAICQPLGRSHSLHSGREELQDTGPRQLRYTRKEWCHWAQTLASPHTEKNTKFLNLRYLVFFNSQKYFWCSDYLPFVTNFCIIWLLPLPPQRSSLRVTWDAVSKAWSPKNSHWIKQFLAFRLWLFFLVNTLQTVLGYDLSLLISFEDLMVFQEVSGMNTKVICNSYSGKEFPGIVKLWWWRNGIVKAC